MKEVFFRILSVLVLAGKIVLVIACGVPVLLFVAICWLVVMFLWYVAKIILSTVMLTGIGWKKMKVLFQIERVGARLDKIFNDDDGYGYSVGLNEEICEVINDLKEKEKKFAAEAKNLKISPWRIGLAEWLAIHPE